MRLLKALLVLGFGTWLCGFCLLIVLPNLMVEATLDQMPFGQDAVRDWQLGTPPPHNSEGPGNDSSPAGVGVGRAYYHDAQWGPPFGNPFLPDFVPYLGCLFHDPNYASHTGVDFPVSVGTIVVSTMGGIVAWAGLNGPWGNLVVVENGRYQTWYAHLSRIAVTVGQPLSPGSALGLSGGARGAPGSGHSTGPHLHYGVKAYADDETARGVWRNPLDFGVWPYTKVACR